MMRSPHKIKFGPVLALGMGSFTYPLTLMEKISPAKNENGKNIKNQLKSSYKIDKLDQSQEPTKTDKILYFVFDWIKNNLFGIGDNESPPTALSAAAIEMESFLASLLLYYWIHTLEFRVCFCLIFLSLKLFEKFSVQFWSLLLTIFFI